MLRLVRWVIGALRRREATGDLDDAAAGGDVGDGGRPLRIARGGRLAVARHLVVQSLVARRPCTVAGRRGGHGDAAVPRPGHPVAGLVRVLDAFDARRRLLLAEVAAGAQALTVVDAGPAALGGGHDVVVVAHGGVAVRGPARAVTPSQEASHRGWELPRPRFDGDHLARGRVPVQASHDDPDLRSVGSVPVSCGIGGLGEGIAQLCAQRLGGHRTVPLDPGEIAAARVQEGTIGDHHSEVEGDRLHAAFAAEHGIGEGIGHQCAVPVAGALGPSALGLEGEALVGELGIEGRQVGADRGHPVLARGEGHVAVLPCGEVAAGGAVGVQLAGGIGDLRPPGLHTGAVHPGHPLVEHLVDLPALQGIQRCRRGRGGVGDLRGDLPAAEGAEHAGHRVHEPARGGERRVGDRG